MIAGIRVLAVLVFLMVAACGAHAETRFALIVGHNFGDTQEMPLRWAEEDARRMQRVLTEVGNVREARTTVLLSPTRAALEAAYTRMQGRIAEARDRAEHAVFFFYFSGHADAQHLHLGNEAVRIDELTRSLAKGPASTTVAIIDACRNDRAPRSRSKGATRAPGFEWPAAAPSIPTGFVLLRSAAQGEVAQESDDLQGSLFSHHLLSGMRGSADADRDGVVTLSELYDYGYRSTLSETHGRTLAVQHSEARVRLEGRGALIISYPKRSESWLGFAPDVSGHLLIIDDRNGRIVAEVRARAEVRVAVAPGRYRVQLRDAGTYATGLLDVPKEGRTLARAELQSQEALDVAKKGRAFDTYPWRLAAGPLVATSHVPGFDSAYGVDTHLSYQLLQRLRVGFGVSAAYAAAAAAAPVVLDRQQVEVGVMAGVDLVAPLTSDVDLLLRPRIGGVWVTQGATRANSARLSQVGLSPDESTRTVFGPQAAAGVALEYFPWSRAGLRIEGTAALAWLSVNGTLDARVIGSGATSLVFRL